MPVRPLGQQNACNVPVMAVAVAAAPAARQLPMYVTHPLSMVRMSRRDNWPQSLTEMLLPLLATEERCDEGIVAGEVWI